jgi:hypothetical protein
MSEFEKQDDGTGIYEKLTEVLDPANTENQMRSTAQESASNQPENVVAIADTAHLQFSTIVPPAPDGEDLLKILSSPPVPYAPRVPRFNRNETPISAKPTPTLPKLPSRAKARLIKKRGADETAAMLAEMARKSLETSEEARKLQLAAMGDAENTAVEQTPPDSPELNELVSARIKALEDELRALNIIQ